MHAIQYLALLILAASCPLKAGTVVITTLPDDAHPLDPLTSLSGIALADGTAIRIGAFPGLDDDQLLNAAATGGYTQIAAALVPFGDSRGIGEGAGGEVGAFEIAVRHEIPDLSSTLAGQEVSLLITRDAGQEFLIARFPGRVFEVDPETGLEPVLSLHLADAKIIVGNRYGTSKLATSPAPAAGSFTAWINGFTAITNPDWRSPGADADGDGRSNFLEYATGGNPGSPADSPPCQIFHGNDGVLWFRFAREAGLGSVRYTVESSGDLTDAWQALGGSIEPDPDPPVPGSFDWMRIRVPLPLGPQEFFRLTVESDLPQ